MDVFSSRCAEKYIKMSYNGIPWQRIARFFVKVYVIHCFRLCQAIRRKKPIQKGRFLINRSGLHETGESVPADVIKSACLTAAGSSEIPHRGGASLHRG